jgi:predicted lipid-binding transport protein (Tim44 family)
MSMKTWLIGVLVVALAATLSPSLSEAKRLGGGKSQGMQRDMPARTAPQQTPPSQQPATNPAQPGAVAPAGAAAAAAAPAKRSWMGPVAGLAAGLGLVALASAFGFGEELANFLMIALLAMATVALVLFLLRRFGRGAGAQPTTAAAGAGAGGQQAGRWEAPTRSAEAAAAQPMARSSHTSFTPAAPAGSTGEVSVTGVPLAPLGGSVSAQEIEAAKSSAPALPAGFDAPAFERVAKMIFLRLQAANDSADLNDLRAFTTPEMFAAVKLEIHERGGAENFTEVLKLDAELVSVVQEPERQVASVRFFGQIREERGAPEAAFDEFWHLVKAEGAASWAIAGIQQRL